jgi:hypothetical protein
LRRPVDEIRRDERNRHHRDERNRDDGQDIAHWEMTSTPLGQTVAKNDSATIAVQNAAKV